MENEEIRPIYDEDDLKTNAKIIVIGVGGGGSNAVNGMIRDKNELVEYWVMNTDSQALANSPCENKLILGKNVTKGLGAGGQPEMGKLAAEDSLPEIEHVIKGADMVFIAAGEGGGTGTGAAPVVAKAAKDAGCLVLGIVTRPFNFEGKSRKLHALEGITELKSNLDALIVVSNDKMMFNNGNLSMRNAFDASDQILALSVKTITEIVLVHGVINLDFADVKATLTGKGLSLIGIGFGEGENKAIDAATNAINSPLLEASIRGARRMIINITAGDDTTLDDAQYAINYITEAAGGDDGDVNIIFGVQNDPSFHGKMKVALIATDFEKDIPLESTDANFNRTKSNLPDRHVPERPIVESKPEPVISQVKTEIKEKNETTALPDYLKDFLVGTPKTEANKEIGTVEISSVEPTTANENKHDHPTSESDESIDGDDDCVIISHKQ